MNYLSKDNEGLKTILDIIKGLQQKNLNFFKNSFNFFLGQHPPFPNSHMCFDFEKNDYKFVSNSIINKSKVVKFEDYIPGNPNTLIKEHVFYYSVLKPHIAVIANADWILNIARQTNRDNLIENRDKAAQIFYDLYKVVVNQENNLFKNILYNKTPLEVPKKRLF